MFSSYNPFNSPKTFPSLQTNGIFELQVTNNAGETVTWTIDLKNTATVFKGKAEPRANVTIILSDDTLVDLASGKVSQFVVTLFLYLIPSFQLNGQKAFMTGKLKLRGNTMLATKLSNVLKVRSRVYIYYRSLTSFRIPGPQGKAVDPYHNQCIPPINILSRLQCSTSPLS